MIGLEVHRSVLDAGDAETGVTIHEVTAELDAGPILAQVAGAGRARRRSGHARGRVLERGASAAGGDAVAGSPRH